MREELLRRILLHHLALIHEKYTGGHLAGKAHLMSTTTMVIPSSAS